MNRAAPPPRETRNWPARDEALERQCCSAESQRTRPSAASTADGASDTRKGHDAIASHGAHAVIPPRKNAKPRKTATAGAAARIFHRQVSKLQVRIAVPNRFTAFGMPVTQPVGQIRPETKAALVIRRSVR